MLTLEPTNDHARPAFRDVESCRLWLGQLQLTNLNLAQASLYREIEEFNRLAMPGKIRLQTLEALRETVALVQRDFARKLAGKALPLTDEELPLLSALGNLWQAMLHGYLRCVQMANAGDAALEKNWHCCNNVACSMPVAGCPLSVRPVTRRMHAAGSSCMRFMPPSNRRPCG